MNGRIFHIYFLYRDIDNYSAINISIYLLLMDNIITTTGYRLGY